ncbi:MAG: hypothetical protein JXX14_18100 [Deltaproteobacteria bacterium]|nr:hypothetical protein [Deltaproteobacteria bacterium]
MLSCTVHGTTSQKDAPRATQQKIDAAKTAPGLQWDTISSDVAPVNLTASDGTGLTLVAYDARAVIQGPLAFTELRLSFANPENRVREGHFEMVLPPSAAISRFAMKINDQWQEAEVVKRQKARQTYESFLHQRQDPALLEKKAGNQFRARVFPIPAKATKQIIISWSQELHRNPYTLYLAGLPAIQQFDVSIEDDTPGNSDPRYTIAQKHLSPPGNLVLNLQHSQNSTAWTGLQSNDLRVVQVTPQLKHSMEDFTDLTVLFDTSASRSPGFENQLKQAAALIADLAKRKKTDFNVTFTCFDQHIKHIYSGPASGFDRKAQQKIIARGALGASDLGYAFKWVKKHNRKSDRLLLYTDAIVTAGSADTSRLKKLLSDLTDAGITRMDAVVFGGIRDETLLNELVTDGLKHSGLVLDGDFTAERISNRLLHKVQSEVPVTVSNANWFWPTSLKGVQSGDSFLIYISAASDAQTAVKLDIPDSQPRRIQFSHVSLPLLERACAIAQINKATTMLGDLNAADEKASLRQGIVNLSVAHRVLSDFTALLVLETEWDFQRFNIDRDSLTDIMVVRDGNIRLMDRDDMVIAADIKSPRREPDNGVGQRHMGEEGRIGIRDSALSNDSIRGFGQMVAAGFDSESALKALMKKQADDDFGFGGLGLNGTGRGGGGTGEGTIGLGSLNTIGHAASPQAHARYSRGAGGLGRAQHSRVMIRTGAATPQQAPRDGSLSESTAAHRGNENLPPLFTESQKRRIEWQNRKRASRTSYEGKLKTVMTLLEQKDIAAAQKAASDWHAQSPGDLLAYIALGEVFEAQKQEWRAARAYGSIIDLYPSRADMRRMAGERLERLNDAGKYLSIDTFKTAVTQRPDHPSGHRLYAWALFRAGRYSEALDAMHKGISQKYPSDRFKGVVTSLRTEAQLMFALAQQQQPDNKALIGMKSLFPKPGKPLAGASARFVLHWESDANDVDLHVFDKHGNHAYYSNKSLPGGGKLSADVTTGYGPEFFTIEGKTANAPYALQAHYYNRGPMGYGMGTLHIIRVDATGQATFEFRPFIVMKDGAFVGLGMAEG